MDAVEAVRVSTATTRGPAIPPLSAPPRQGRNRDISWGGMHSPVFAGEYLHYPFMPDFHAALMKSMGR